MSEAVSHANRAVTTANRDGMVANATTAVTASYTFASAAPPEGRTVTLPGGTPQAGGRQHQPGRQDGVVPVTVQTSQYSRPGWRPAVTVEVS